MRVLRRAWRRTAAGPSVGLALDVHAPALGLEAPLAGTLDVALIAIKITTGVRAIQYIFQV